MGEKDMKVPRCAHCGSSDVQLRKRITSNGVFQISWRCLSCDHWAGMPMKWIPHDVIRKVLLPKNCTLDDIQTIEDNSNNDLCLICGKPGEKHHWAPQAYSDFFGDEWYLWPIVSLCKEHHNQWHRIVTPSLVYHSKTDSEK